MASPMAGPGPTEVRFLTTRTPVQTAPAAPPAVLLLVPGASAALAIERALALRPDVTVTVTVTQTLPTPGRSVGVHDLIAIDLSGPHGGFLAFGVEVLAANPDAELVFFGEDVASPCAAAAAALGLGSTVIGPGARAWLIGALATLVGVARARRALRQAEAAIPPLPGGCTASIPVAISPSATGVVLPLPVAETQFREAYVRGVLAVAGDRTRAAKLAGIPYRTLCRIAQMVDAGSDRAAGRK